MEVVMSDYNEIRREKLFRQLGVLAFLVFAASNIVLTLETLSQY
jgi:hypothetical protein